jgi:hypothetical protein
MAKEVPDAHYNASYYHLLIKELAISVLTDLFCSFLPAYILWNVQIKLSTKITICCLTALGLGATASNIARNVYFGALDSRDFTCQLHSHLSWIFHVNVPG